MLLGADWKVGKQPCLKNGEGILQILLGVVMCGSN